MSQSTLMPADGRSESMPVLTNRTMNGTANSFVSTVSSSSATRLGPFSDDTQIITMNSNAAVYFVTGNSDVTATTTTAHFFPANLYYDFNVYWGGQAFGNSATEHQYISLITSDASKDANVHISERI